MSQEVQQEPQVSTTTMTTTATTTSSSSSSNNASSSSPSRPQRIRRMPAYLEEYELDLDLRRASLKDTLSPKRQKAKKTVRQLNDTQQRRQQRADASRQQQQQQSSSSSTTPAPRRTNNNSLRTAITTATTSTATTVPATTTTTFVNPIDRFAVTNTAADAHNRFREYQSASIDEEEALRQLLNQSAFETSFKDEIILGSHCRHKWAISQLPENVQSVKYMSSLIDGQERSISVDDVISGCHYHPGKIHNPFQKPTVEIVFSFDATGSMYQAIDTLKQKLQNLFRQLLTDLPGIRIAVIAHGDFCDYNVFYTMCKLDFTNDLDTLVQFVQTIQMCGGGDPAECYEMVLKECSALNWYKKTPDATEYDDNISRVVVVIGDDVPHLSDDYFKIDWRAELKSLYDELLIKAYGVQCLGREYANEFYQELADLTYGTRLELENFNKMHELVLALCYRESAEHASIAFANSSNDGGAASSTSTSSSSTEQVISQGKLSDEEMLQIHYAIHSPEQATVTIQGISYDISVNDLQCRFLRVHDIVYIEQDKKKSTKYAKMANEGHKITWITHKGVWGLIIDDSFVRR